MRKKTMFLAAGACLATLTLAVGTAIADPTGPPSPRELVGVGAQTTQGVFNDLANIITDDGTHGLPAGTKIIGSYDNAPPGTITTKPPPANCTITRPSQGGAGTDALVHSLQASDGCVQFARVVTNDSASRPGTGLTYIPFAIDALTYAVRDDSTIPRNLTAANLTAIYNCQVPSIQPLIGVFGAGNRTFFLKKLGFTDSPTFAGSPGHECVKDTDSTGASLLANDGRLLTAPNQLVTYSSAPYLAQVSGVEPDIHGRAILGSINSISPAVLNSNSVIPQGSNDALAYAVRGDSSIPKSLSIANLKAVYNCQVPSINPLLESFGSARRATFLNALGFIDSAGFAGSAGHACVKDTDSAANPVGDNDGRVLTSPGQLVPYSISQYLSQINGAAPDLHGRTILGSINSVSPAVLNNSSFMSREVYNVVPTSQIGSGTPTNYVFVGSGSQVCANAQKIQNHGFNTDPNCGSTTIQTP